MKLQLRGQLASVDVIELSVGGATVRVLPRQLNDGENLCVCDEDMAPCMAFVKEQGLMPEDDKMLAGIRKRQMKGGKVVCRVMKKQESDVSDESKSYNTLAEVIVALEQV